MAAGDGHAFSDEGVEFTRSGDGSRINVMWAMEGTFGEKKLTSDKRRELIDLLTAPTIPERFNPEHRCDVGEDHCPRCGAP